MMFYNALDLVEAPIVFGLFHSGDAIRFPARTPSLMHHGLEYGASRANNSAVVSAVHRLMNAGPFLVCQFCHFTTLQIDAVFPRRRNSAASRERVVAAPHRESV
jgi:hypothetical protein